MTRREKSILLMVLLAFIYGVHSIFFASSSKPGFADRPQSLEELSKFATEVSQHVAHEDSSDIDAYILTRAFTEWNKEPFLKSDIPGESAEAVEKIEGAKQKVNLIYTGYLKTPYKSLAIINGKEYEEGERIGETEYILRRIWPTRIVIGVTGKKRNIILELEETK